MAQAILGGLLREGTQPTLLSVIEPFAPTRLQLSDMQQGIHIFSNIDAAGALAALQKTDLVVWAVKPQILRAVALECIQKNAFKNGVLHFSVAAGIPSTALATWLENDNIVRAMPNTPALIGQGITGLFARSTVQVEQKQWVSQLCANMGEMLWMINENQLDAVTAVSGSGPAYVFYFLAAMQQAGVELGLSAEQSKQLAIQTFAGATELARQSNDDLASLQEKVTSKGGTTHAALESMKKSDIGQQFISAMHSAQQRAVAMGQEFVD